MKFYGRELLLAGILPALSGLAFPASGDSSVAPPFAPLLASDSTPVFPLDSATSSHPVEQTVAQGHVLDQRVVSLPEGEVRRTRLVRSGIHPGALLVSEDWQKDASRSNWVCLRREMFLADQLIIKVHAQTSENAVRELLHRLDMDFGEFVAPDVCTARLREASIDGMRRALITLGTNTSAVEIVEADGVGFGGGIPNDAYFTNQWGIHNVGQSSGMADADVDGPELWDVLENTSGIVVAVLDSGLNFTHPDLQGITWTNTAEIPGDGVDNDSNGRVDDFRGWDFANGDNNPTDDHGHGSNVTGIIAANRNNGMGIAGMIGGVKILVCKILNANNSGLTSSLIAATTYARQMGVPIMNLSLQNYPFNAILNTEFNDCQSAGILLSICAGNQGVDNDVTPNYPSCYPQTNILAAGNHDRMDVRWADTFNPSNYGLTNVDLFAPGTDILSPVLGTSYAYYVGTSQAAPFVTAVAAAMKYLNPDWNASEIKSGILGSVITRPSYNGLCLSGGRLNALASVARAIRSQPNNDRDMDGFPNLFEYLVGTRMDTQVSYPKVTNWLANGFLHLSVPQTPRADGHLEIEQATNLGNWTTSGVTDFGNTNLLHGGIPTEPNPAGFMRLRAVIDP
ncbi:MAG TPA: S8 family peptidase [Verrucomicrobiae bacterium]|nr:S8 family peptidase [Verrucomicrobiae bacterium]